jgi:hypothetical protein
VKQNVNSREELNKLFSQLEINDTKVIKSVEASIAQYFKKD